MKSKSLLFWIPAALLAVAALAEGGMHARGAKHVSTTTAAPLASCYARELTLDIDGDGKPEQLKMVRIGDDTWADVYFAGQLRSSTRLGAWHDDAEIEAIDVNGDGRFDLVRRWNEGAKRHAQVWLSDGRAFDQGWTGINENTCVAQR